MTTRFRATHRPLSRFLQGFGIGIIPAAMPAQRPKQPPARGAAPRAAASPAPQPGRPAPHTERALEILARLRRLYPEADCELEYQEPYQLLVATILSAQATDRSVNLVTPALFARYPDAAALARATPEELQPQIASIGLFRNKAKALIAAARQVVERHLGVVPRERQALEALPGVGRKTANVVLANAFGEPALAVDTHVTRLAGRLGLSTQRDPARIESDLTALFPPTDWGFVSHALIWHGRRVCSARSPRCAVCELAPLCPSAARLGGRAQAAARRTRS